MKKDKKRKPNAGLEPATTNDVRTKVEVCIVCCHD